MWSVSQPWDTQSESQNPADSPQSPSLTLVFLVSVVSDDQLCSCILVDCWLAGIGVPRDSDESRVSNWSPPMLAECDAQ